MAKNVWLPHELVVIRYSLTECGHWGSGGPLPLVMGGRRLNLGKRPFVAAVPASPELVGLESESFQVFNPASVNPTASSGIAHLRVPSLSAPAQPSLAQDSSALLVCWHLRLFASDDGETPTAAISTPLPIQVVTVPPAPPSCVSMCDRSHVSVTLTWPETIHNGGADVEMYEVGMWETNAVKAHK